MRQEQELNQRTDAFDYDLPPELIAQGPAGRREHARLLVHAAGGGETRHARVAELGSFLAPGDLLVLNDTRVLHARIHGRRESGAQVELLFIEPAPAVECGSGVSAASEPWQAMCNPARKLRPGEQVLLAGGAVRATMNERPYGPDGRPGAYWIVQLEELGSTCQDVPEILRRHGSVPLPPYIQSESGNASRDRERYQTVYAARPGAVAAPTAGLHFTPELLAELDGKGVKTARLTLHVGPGTFRPIDAECIGEHVMHSERFELPAATVTAVEETRARGGRVVCVGTTTVRVLEAVAAQGELRSCTGRTDLFIHPGFQFRVVDALLTNFHLPRSSLLVLVSALVGRERVLSLYAEAIRERYRFYSYGDAMLLLR